MPAFRRLLADGEVEVPAELARELAELNRGRMVVIPAGYPLVFVQPRPRPIVQTLPVYLL